MTYPRLRTPAEEPAAAGWAACGLDRLAEEVARIAIAPPPNVGVVAIDGRSGSGKSTLAAALAARLTGSIVVHTDDVAWWESFFGWDRLMITGILAPLKEGRAVRYRPPAWDERNRSGDIAVPGGTRVVLVEGVGASRRSLMPYLSASVWVQADADEARRRGIARDAALGRSPEQAARFWDEWMAEEDPFLADDRPWQRADWIVCGTPSLVPAVLGASEVLLATPEPVTAA